MLLIVVQRAERVALVVQPDSVVRQRRPKGGSRPGQPRLWAGSANQARSSPSLELTGCRPDSPSTATNDVLPRTEVDHH